VNAGTINLGDPIRVTIEKVGDNTLLGEIIKLMENAEQGKSKYVQLSDKIAGYFTPIILLLSLITFSIWVFQADLLTASIHAISVLIITCPCALGLAIPVVQIVASSKLMDEGVLIKTSDALEKLAVIDCVIFDKTGTLTTGKLSPQNIAEFNTDELKLIASIASHSNHPMAKALSKLYTGPLLKLNVKEHKGLGLDTKVKGEVIKIGNSKFCESIESKDDALSEIWFKHGITLKRMIFTDPIREDASQVADYFINKQQLPCTILSGDKSRVVSEVAKKVGIADYKAAIDPKQKYEFIAKLVKKGNKVLMIGDGLNDSAALKAAYISISPASGLEISQTASDIVFQGERLSSLQHSHYIAKQSQEIVKQNLVLSAGYNLVTVPIAMLGLASPIIAAIGMSLSSIVVVLNSLRLNNIKY
jgi:Cu2+-exporting ATPase